MNENRIKTVSVIGCGHMGWIFGFHCAVYGYPIKFYDVNQAAIDKAEQLITDELDSRVKQQQLSEEEKQSVFGRFFFTRQLKEAVAEADLVFETVPEKIELKREIFARLDELAPSHAILATGSSSLPVSQIEDVTKRLDRVLNTHYYPPIWQMPMGELMRGKKTSEETLHRVRQFMRDIDVVPLMVLKESTGFLFNRIWRAIKKECLTVADTGVGTFEDIDRAWSIFTRVFQRVPGPFALMDTIGLDTILDIERVYYEKSGKMEDTPPNILINRVEKKELGVKAGGGFYTYPNPAFQMPHWLTGGE